MAETFVVPEAATAHTIKYTQAWIIYYKIKNKFRTDADKMWKMFSKYKQIIEFEIYENRKWL